MRVCRDERRSYDVVVELSHDWVTFPWQFSLHGLPCKIVSEWKSKIMNAGASMIERDIGSVE